MRSNDTFSLRFCGLRQSDDEHFVGLVGAEVLSRLESVAASTGSGCHAGSVELSPKLAAMGVPERVGMGAVRFSLGRTTTEAEIDAVIDQLGAALVLTQGYARRLPRPKAATREQ
jgi:cysteine sulfinate desulfinase/cysteine desulfurase-like protein